MDSSDGNLCLHYFLGILRDTNIESNDNFLQFLTYNLTLAQNNLKIAVQIILYPNYFKIGVF